MTTNAPETQLGADIKKLGFGLMRLPQLKPQVEGEKGAIDIEQTKQMVDMFLDAGFTYFDTAWAYEGSEDAIRQALVERHPRESYQLATKSAAWINCTSKEEAEARFDESLARTGAGYFDFYLLHNLGETRTHFFDDFGQWEFVQRKKAEGLIRHVGFSFHSTPEELDEILRAHPEMEFVQLQINYADWDFAAVQSRRCYEVARAHGKPIIVMEPVKGGNLADLPEDAAAVLDALHGGSSASYAIRFAAGFPGIRMVLSGMSDLQQVEDNIAFMRDFKPLDETELAAVKRVQEIFRSKSLIPCTACRYCTAGCPQHISIPDLFAVMNAKQIHRDWNADYYYSEVYTKNGGRASDCIRCGKCEKVCPQHLHIRDLLADIAAEFEKKG